MTNIKTFFRMLKQLYDLLNKKQRCKCLLLLGLFLVTATLETLGVSVVLPFILAMLSPDSLREYGIVQVASEYVDLSDNSVLILCTAVLIILVYVLKNGIIIWANYVQARVRNGIEKDMSMLTLKSYMKKPYPFFLNVNSSQIIRVVHEDTISIAEIIDAFSGLAAELLTCGLLTVFLVVLNPVMAFGLLGVAMVSALLIIIGFKKKIAECGDMSRENYIQRYQYLCQMVHGIKEVTVTQRKKSFVEKYEDVAERARHYNTVYKSIAKMPSRLIETTFIGSLLILVYLCMGDENNTVQLVTQLGTMAVAAVRLLPSASNITVYMNTLVYQRPALEVAYDTIMASDMLSETDEITDVYVIEDKYENVSFESKIQIDKISWKYDVDGRDILADLDLVINKGESVAFIGESGAGKTTLADIILGLLKPQKGSVTVDGTDIYAIPNRWAEIIGYVPQSVYMIDDSIRRNIAFGIKDSEIDDEKIWSALAQARLDEFVKALPEGLDTMMGERGVKVSGGQRQRIAIARALYNNPEILVLDEATSALDTETETAVMESIEALQGKKTLIIVAHRLSTIRKCDSIYEIKNGAAVKRIKEELFE